MDSVFDDVDSDVDDLVAPSTGKSASRQQKREEQKAAAKEKKQAALAAREEKKANQAADRADRVAFTDSVGGSRGIQKAVRWTVGAVAAMLLVVGAVQIFRAPAKPITQNDVQQAVAEQLSGNGFPTAPAESFAIRYARVYYTWNGADSAAKANRTAALAGYTTDSTPDGWDGRGAQTVVAGPYIAAATTTSDANHGTVTLAIQVDSGAWIYPMVPVYSDGAGGLTVGGVPTLGPPPGHAGFPGADGSITGDVDEDASRAVSSVLTGFFTAWARSDAAALDRYLTQDATVATRIGLGGSVQYVSLTDVTVAAAADPDSAADRRASVQVVWATGNPEQPTTGKLTQTYLLTITQTAGLWSVRDITVGSPRLSAGRVAEPSTSTTPAPLTVSASATPTGS